MYTLKVKTNKNPPVTFKGKVDGESSLKTLKQALCELTCIPVMKQKILIGYPPTQVVSSDEEKLKTIGLHNGEVIIVEEVASSENISKTLKHSSDIQSRIDHSSFPRGTLLKKIVPSDNSCLFTSIYYLINGGEVDAENLLNMRETVAKVISEEPAMYNEALLEKSNQDYCRWIQKDTSWGGAIELSILSDYYQIEIVALDVKSGLMNRFGEDKRHIQRIFLMYDGIHYDPLYLETNDGRELYVFPSSEGWLLEQANSLVREAKTAGHFTDTNKFCLVCNECGLNMHGEEAAVHHAKTTSHSNFAEVKRDL